MDTLGKITSLVTALASYRNRLSLLLKRPVSEIDVLYKEAYRSGLVKELNKKAPIPIGRCYLSMLSPYRAPLFYVVCRVLKPNAVVETGVRDGYSSSFILLALQMNKKGKLFSIDLPNAPGQALPKDTSTGWLIPQGLKDRWKLIVGSSREKLVPLLFDLKQIDIFYHDSDHSHENMMFEFNAAWGYVRQGGCLLSDDITDNFAFDDFIKANPPRAFMKLFKTGAALKQ